MPRQLCRTIAGLTLLVTVASGSAAQACNVPVFRYALENWWPDAYRLTLFHREELSEADQALIHALETQRGNSLFNLNIRRVDVANLDNDADRELFASQSSPQLPWLGVQYPAHLRIEKPVWSGALTTEAIAKLTDSPVRRELVKRLIEGDTAVWLMLDSDRADADSAAAAVLRDELPRLQQSLKLPDLTESPEDILRGSPPLRLSFSLLRVQREDPAEQPLVAMLLGSEPDLAELTEPLVFPVFGRGRALFALVGAGISAENIRSSAAFLTGACSCQVKELNPGFDLLIAADWTDLLSLREPGLMELASTTAAASTGPELVPIASGSSVDVGSSESAAPAQRGGSKMMFLGAFAVAALLLMIAWRR